MKGKDVVSKEELIIRLAYAAVDRPLPIKLSSSEVVTYFKGDRDTDVRSLATHYTIKVMAESMAEYVTKLLVEVGSQRPKH